MGEILVGVMVFCHIPILHPCLRQGVDMIISTVTEPKTESVSGVPPLVLHAGHMRAQQLPQTVRVTAKIWNSVWCFVVVSAWTSDEEAQ